MNSPLFVPPNTFTLKNLTFAHLRFGKPLWWYPKLVPNPASSERASMFRYHLAELNRTQTHIVSLQFLSTGCFTTWCFSPIFGEGGFRWRGALDCFLRDIVRPFFDELDSRLDDCGRSTAEIQAPCAVKVKQQHSLLWKSPQTFACRCFYRQRERGIFISSQRSRM